MTKERKLAIELWIKIREKIREEDISPREIRLIKEVFAAENNLKWKNECYFCTYVRNGLVAFQCLQGCEKCPIAKVRARKNTYICGCGYFSVYHIACNYNLPKFISCLISSASILLL